MRVDRGRLDKTLTGHAGSTILATQSNSYFVRLGVKWSQVQILSARPTGMGRDMLRCPQLTDYTTRRLGPFWDHAVRNFFTDIKVDDDAEVITSDAFTSLMGL